MAIINLQTIPTAPASPVPRVSSASTAFWNNYFKVHQSVLSVRERKALSIIGLIHELNIVRSIDYRTNHPALIQDASVFLGQHSMFDLDTAFAVIDWSNGALADAALSTNLEALRAESRRLVELSELQLNQIMALLEIQLAE